MHTMSEFSDFFVDHYAVLGVEHTDDVETIKKAYRKLALKYHPDKGGMAAEFLKIQKAVEVLIDKFDRAAFDAVLYARKRVRERESSHSSSHYCPPGMSFKEPGESQRQWKPEAPRRRPRCGHYGCPGHNGNISFTFRETWRLILAHKPRVHRLQEDLLDIMSANEPHTYPRRGNRLGKMYDRVGRYLDFTHRWLETWERDQLELASPDDWGYACDDFDLIECLRRMAEDIKHWTDHSMRNARDIDRIARRATRGLSVYDLRAEEIRYNCLVDLEVEMALWPKFTWNIGFRKYDY